MLTAREFPLGLFEDGDIRVGVFPEGEEVLVGLSGFGERVAWERGRLARCGRGILPVFFVFARAGRSRESGRDGRATAGFRIVFQAL